MAGLKSWAEKGRVLAYDETQKITFANVGRLFASLEPGPALDAMDKLFENLLNGIRASPYNFPGTAYRCAVQSRKKLGAIFRAKLEEKKIHNRDSDANDDLMDGLMKIKDEEGNRLSDDEVIDNIVSLIVAGYKSTAMAAMWAVYHLAKYPNVLKKLREENMALSKERNGGFITSEDVASLKYTNKAVEESIRVANIAAFVFRTAVRDVEYQGYIFPKGWTIVPWVRYMHTNPEHFDDPLTFNPDRWNEPAKPGTYLVFGGGSRICAGNMLARIQLALFIHHLTVRYKWELVNPDAPIIYLSHPRPSDKGEVIVSKI
uniref:Ent-kaurenoic acid oxidase n=1 Tax=Kalanchoe fedtschenkoi TaxID=63787 RepID=A0A7N0VEG5_KALFE